MPKNFVIDRLTINGVEIPVAESPQVSPNANEDAVARLSEMAEALEAAELPEFIISTASSASAS